MKLEKLDIRLEQKYLNGYGAPPVPVYIGTVKFRQEIGNIEIVLNEEQIRHIVGTVGNSLIDATKIAAKAMSDSIIEETSFAKITSQGEIT